MALRATSKKLEFICAADPDVPAEWRGDSGRLRQILTNLAGNAIKFTERGEVAIHVSVSGDPRQGMLRFSVRDSGIGIPSHKLPLLFDKFSQVDASTTRHYGGTGLGLAISKQLAALFGGEIGVTSDPGVGSEFWFTVRLAQPAIRRRRDTQLPALAGVQVLVLDDNASNRSALVRRLAGWGLHADEASDAVTAMIRLREAAARNAGYALVFVDREMPGITGDLFAGLVRSEPDLASVRLVLMTALGSPTDAAQLARTGFAAHITKPFHQQDLQQLLLDLVAARTAGSAGAPDPGAGLAPAPSATLSAIPVSEAPVTAPAVVAPVSESAARRGRILVAEDNPINQMVALKMLAKLGYRAEAVANGQEALKALASIPYDLVLMDCQMPEMDGFEARCSPSWGTVPRLSPMARRR